MSMTEVICTLRRCHSVDIVNRSTRLVLSPPVGSHTEAVDHSETGRYNHDLEF